MGTKLVWRLFRSPHLKWVRLLNLKYLNGDGPIQIFRETNPPRGSCLWNFMLDCRKIISNRLTWNLGSGDKALFWSDSWGGYKAIEKIHDFGVTRALLESHIGPLLNSYLSPSKEGVGWQWIERDDEAILEKDKHKLMSILNSRNFVLSHDEDKLIWEGSLRGEYNSKDGYSHISKSFLRPKSELPLNLCWDRNCLPKAGIFS